MIRPVSILFLCILPLSVGAQTLTWEEAVRMAADQNPALQAAEASYQSAHEQALSAIGGYLPQVSSNISYSKANSGTSSIGNLGVVSSNATYSFSTSISQNIFNGLSDLAKRKQAQGNEGIAQANLKSIQAQVSYNLKIAFENLDFAKKALILSRQIIGRRKINLKLVELRFKGGHENKGSVLLYEAYLKDAKYGETQNLNLINTSKVQLAQVLGLDDAESLDIMGSVPVQKRVDSAHVENFAAHAPTYLQALHQEEATHAGIMLARSGFFPTLGVTGSVGRSGEWFPENDRWTIGINLTVPIFNGGKVLHGTRAAVATHTASQFNLKNVLHQVRTTIQQNYNVYMESIQKFEVDQSYLKAAEIRAQIARANYKNGLVSFQEWDLAENDLITRERNLLQSEQNRVNAEAAYFQAIGEGVL